MSLFLNPDEQSALGVIKSVKQSRRSDGCPILKFSFHRKPAVGATVEGTAPPPHPIQFFLKNSLEGQFVADQMDGTLCQWAQEETMLFVIPEGPGLLISDGSHWIVLHNEVDPESVP